MPTLQEIEQQAAEKLTPEDILSALAELKREVQARDNSDPLIVQIRQKGINAVRAYHEKTGNYPPPFHSDNPTLQDFVNAGWIARPYHAPGVVDWVGNAVKSAGRSVGSLIQYTDQALGSIGDELNKVPYVGSALHAVYKMYTAPYDIADEVSKGKRIDRIALDALRNQAAYAKEVAPYVQTVIALVPGIGPVVSGGISASLALAEGKGIDQALEDGIAGALPGGALAKAAFHVSVKLLEGKSIGDAGAQAVQDLGDASGIHIPDVAKTMLAAGFNVTQKVASGESVDRASLEVASQYFDVVGQAILKSAPASEVADLLTEKGQSMLPGVSATAQKALQGGTSIGIAIGHAKALQSVAKLNLTSGPVQQALADSGNALMKSDAVSSAGAKLLNVVQQKGYELAIGTMQKRVGQYAFNVLRNSVDGDTKKGFDIGVSLRIGMVAHQAPAPAPAPPPAPPKVNYPMPAPPPVHKSPVSRASWFITMGMMGAAPSQKVGMVSQLHTNKLGAVGNIAAIAHVNLKRRPWFVRAWFWIWGE